MMIKDKLKSIQQFISICIYTSEMKPLTRNMFITKNIHVHQFSTQSIKYKRVTKYGLLKKAIPRVYVKSYFGPDFQDIWVWITIKVQAALYIYLIWKKYLLLNAEHYLHIRYGRYQPWSCQMYFTMSCIPNQSITDLSIFSHTIWNQTGFHK